ncbi:probable pyruvate dehydrogenase E1 component subunit alpha, mitochondrial isoform X3 [Halyomorpha halys]|uniref:probable pyruvate dehydrogenase E1 component subunit alpha, mitochondrial isoform X3 n=1 Tax=Halyomorpha halys TaxID=286706 RepID=UPI0034D2B033
MYSQLSFRGLAGASVYKTLRAGVAYQVDKPFKLYKLSVGPDSKVDITKEDALRYYKQMVVIRRMENLLANLYKNQEMRGFCHLYAGQVPIGVGVALSMKYANTGGICMTLYGDGAANQGQTHESFNLAKVLNLPVVFVCENNKFAMGTADFRGSGSVDYYTRGSFLPGLWVDGMDVLAVREATRFAKAHIFANKGPIVMELETYRYYGHSMSDPGTSYRTRDDIQAVRNERDPITKFKDRLVTLKIATEEELNKIQKDVKKNLDDDVKKARGDPHPKLDELATDVYQKPYQKQVRGMSPFTPLDHKSIGKAIVQHLKIK